MSTDTAAPPQGNESDSAPDTETEQLKTEGQEQTDAEPNSEAQGADGAEPREEGKRKRGLSERALEYRNQARDAQRMNERLFGLIEQTLVKGQAPKVDQPQGPPTKENFGTYEEYLEALADYKVAERVKEIESRAERSKQVQAVERLEQSWEARLQAAADKDEDFEEYIENVGTKIHQLAGIAIKESESGVDVVKYLGENQDELKRISQLSAPAQVREIGKIEARLESKAESTKRASKAPPPIEPVGSGKSTKSDLTQMSQAEYEAMRKKQGAWWAR